ncbi:MAG: hypothetical protein JWO06_1556, partial [Bacteroidota bacterium]|nr:hypothetical protein [Bacteroidota bacterium]
PTSVIVTAHNTSTFTDMFAISTTNVTTTSVQVNVYRVDGTSGGGWSQNLQLDWIAIQ